MFQRENAMVSHQYNKALVIFLVSVATSWNYEAKHSQPRVVADAAFATKSRRMIKVTNCVDSVSSRSKLFCRNAVQSKLESKKSHDVENKPILSISDSESLSSKSKEPTTNRRRKILSQIQKDVASIIWTSLVFGENSAYAQQDDLLLDATKRIKQKTIVITGANSGIGFEACKRLIKQGHTIILACRTINKAQDAIGRIQHNEIMMNNGKLIPAECDLADLTSIEKFVNNLSATFEKIDTLCLNAGVARNTAATDCARTKDGFELTGKALLFVCTHR
jgi:short chain dehydrogenase